METWSTRAIWNRITNFWTPNMTVHWSHWEGWVQWLDEVARAKLRWRAELWVSFIQKTCSWSLAIDKLTGPGVCTYCQWSVACKSWIQNGLEVRSSSKLRNGISIGLGKEELVVTVTVKAMICLLLLLSNGPHWIRFDRLGDTVTRFTKSRSTLTRSIHRTHSVSAWLVFSNLNSSQ